MQRHQEILISVLLIVSVAVLVVPALVFIVRKLTQKSSERVVKRSSTHKILTFSLCLMCAVWCLRYAVGYSMIINPETEGFTLTWLEEIFNSMVHALQTFSMDEDYTQYIIDGRRMISMLFGDGTVWEGIYGVYASVLNVAAPVAGGAIIFEILASIFPRAKLWLADGLFWKEKYFFSELNEASLALAKSIYSTRVSVWKRPVLVFTDSYVDDEDEKGSEILLEAKALGAICVRDDLSHVRKNRWGMRKFFLVDEAEAGNLQTLADLANSSNSVYLKKAEIYLFTVDDAYVQVERSVQNRLKLDLHFEEDELPTFVPILSYRNLISNLLVDIPLYEPLVGKPRNEKGEQDLVVTILGTGYIGTEMFLSTYWLGQILDCNLKIHVLSQETPEQFWSKIDYINPEIRYTTINGHEVLRINSKGDLAPVYCEVDYRQCDVKSSKFIESLTNQGENILDTDYFLVSLGTDEDNISVANILKKYIGEQHLKASALQRTIITYVVYDPALADVLNRQKFFSFVKGETDIYMQAIGCLRDVYSVRNVFMEEYEPFLRQMRDAYELIQDRKGRAKTHAERMADDYKHWADRARSMHSKYKVYSMGLIHQSMFDFPDDPAAYAAEMEKSYEACRKIVIGDFEFESPEHEQKHITLLHRMAWLEHRRWNAFTRVKGFRSTKAYPAYACADVQGSYKQMELKLHPCLVECDQLGIRAKISSKGVIDPESLFCETDTSKFDRLDELSYDLKQKGYNNFDFKQYDYPIDAMKWKEDEDVQTESH